MAVLLLRAGIGWITIDGVKISAKIMQMMTRDNDDMPDLAAFLALETKVWEALVKGDNDADAALLTPDFLGVYPSGFAGRADHSGQLGNGPVMARYRFDQARLRTIGRDHALLSYRASYRRVGQGACSEVMFITSLWQRTDAGWLNSFSQDTPAA